MKVAQVHMFRRRLTERQRRHYIVHDYSLVSDFLRCGYSEVENGYKNNNLLLTTNASVPHKNKSLCKSVSSNDSSCNGTNNSQDCPPKMSINKTDLLPLLQTVTETESDNMIRNLSIEDKLRQQISCLQYFRKPFVM